MTAQLFKTYEGTEGQAVRDLIDKSTSDYYGQIEGVLAELRKNGTDTADFEWVSGYPSEEVTNKAVLACQLDIKMGEVSHTIDRRWLLRKVDVPGREMQDEDDCSHEDSVICPYCGHKQDPSDGFGVNNDDDTNELACERCDKDFTVKLHVSYSYSTSPVGGWLKRRPV